MRHFRYPNLLSFLLIAAFMVLRFSVGAHAIEFGSESHEHDGKACIVTLVSEDEADELIILPSGMVYTPLSWIEAYTPSHIVELQIPSRSIFCARGPPQL